MKNAIKSAFITTALLLCCSFAVFGQNRQITGSLVGDDQQPVQFASIVIQAPDSTYFYAVVCDSLGVFSFKTELPSYRLIIQHLLYETKELQSSMDNLGVIEMNRRTQEVGDVLVVGERPLVVVNDGVLSYDMQRIADEKVVSSVYDAILHLPGVSEQNDVISLVGAAGVTIIINGNPSTMSASQLVNLLKQMPASRVKRAEVMYSASPEYHVRGAAINLVIDDFAKKGEEPLFQGEVNAEYRQKHYATYSSGISMLYSSNKLTADLLYSFSDRRVRSGLNLLSDHNVLNEIYRVEQNSISKSSGKRHTARLNVDFKPSDKSLLSFTYNTSIDTDGKGRSRSQGNVSNSKIKSESSERFHNFGLNYSSEFGLKAGVNYTHFNEPHTQYVVDLSDEGETEFKSKSKQNINALNLFVDQAHQLGEGWKLTYGAEYRYAKDHDYQLYSAKKGEAQLEDTDSRIEEQIVDFYLGAAKEFTEKLSANLSLMTEYYKLAEDDEWTLFPQARLIYFHSRKHILQFSFSSDKRYPKYWEKQDFMVFMDGYTRIYGNPKLKPYNNYQAQLTYILKQKYLFTLFYNYQPKYFVQQAYQSANELLLLYQTQNWKYNQTTGLSVTVPFKIQEWLSSRITLTGLHLKSRHDHFYDISFKRDKFIGMAKIDNTINVSSKPNIKLEISANYTTKLIQGIYDLSHYWSVNAGLKYTFAKDKAELRVRGYDIFQSSTIKVLVNSHGQKFDMRVFPDNRYLSLSFSYKFGGYKERQHKAIDKSRYGH